MNPKSEKEIKKERVYKGRTYTIVDVPPSFLHKSDPLKAWIDKKIYYVKNREKKLLYEKNRQLENPELRKKKNEYLKEYRKRPEVTEKQNSAEYKAKQKINKGKYRASEKGQETDKAYNEKYNPRKKELDKLRREDTEWVEKDREWHRKHSKKPEIMARRRELDNIRSKKDSIKKSLRTLLYNALRRYTDEGKIHKSSKYNIDYEKCVKKLEEEAKSNGYTVEEMRNMNYTIDHIIPMAEYNFKINKDVGNCFKPINLRWLKYSENSTKNDRVRPEDLEVIKTLPKEIFPKGKDLGYFKSICKS